MKIAIIGGTGQIGLALRDRLSRDHHEVVVTGRRIEANVQADLATPEGIDAVTVAAEPAEMVIFCAGVWRFAGLNRFVEEDIDRTLAINLRAPIEITRRLVPEWRERGKGTLVYMLSELAHKPQAGGALYCATKYGLHGFAAALRLEVASSGLRVVTVSPGIVGGEHGLRPSDLADRIIEGMAAGQDEIHIPTPA